MFYRRQALTLLGSTVAVAFASAAAPAHAVASQQLTGSLAIEIALPGREDSAAYRMDNDGWTIQEGWVFVEGQHVGLLPVTTTMKVTPGRYEIKVILFQFGEAGARRFVTFSWPVSVSVGRTTPVTFDVRYFGFWIDCTRAEKPSVSADACGRLPPGFTAQVSEDVPTARVPAMYRYTNNTAGKVREAIAAMEGQVQELERSDVWKAVQSAARRIEIYPPSRPRLWMELPKEFGGRVEMDASHLRALGVWLRGNISPPRMFIQPPASGEDQTFRQIEEHLRRAEEWIETYRTNVGETIEFIAKKLEHAGKAGDGKR